ncbi:MAG: hypothetical protein EHM93_02005 [Bacteroidales bacterium]|nr:MAG: hypothetical protein EHM93_02005 [Bacteroidales bacterium]
MKKLTFILFSICILLVGCKNKKTIVNDNIFNSDLPEAVAKVFSPNQISSGLNDRDLAISPKYDELFYCILEEPHFTIVHIKMDANGVWGKPQIAPFSGKFNDCEPMFSPDGKRLYFCSNRPLENSGKEKDYDIWYVDRTPHGWSSPVNIGLPINTSKNEFFPSLTNNNTLYFTSASMKIMRAKFKNGKYLEPELLSDSINTKVGEYNAVVAPDESFLIYTSHGWPNDMGQGDLYISFKKTDETWTKAKNLGKGVNSPYTEMSPSLSPDGQYLFFASNRSLNLNDRSPNLTFEDLQKKAMHYDNGRFNIFWVDIKELIGSLK